jgi:hypothetical protein
MLPRTIIGSSCEDAADEEACLAERKSEPVLRSHPVPFWAAR